MTDFEEIREQMNLLSDEELISILREHDLEQWRPEVFNIVESILLTRGVSYGEALEELKRKENSLDETAGLDLVTVATYASYLDAETDRLALEAKGLESWIFNEQGPQSTGAFTGVQLQVRAEDLAAAMGILESQPVPSSDLPADIAEPPCPKCGSRNVTESAEKVESFDLTTGVVPETKWFYHCASCSHKWSES